MDRNKIFSVPGVVLTAVVGVLPWAAVIFAPVWPVMVVCAVCTVLAAVALLLGIADGKRRNQDLQTQILQLQSILETEEMAFDTAEEGLAQLSAAASAQQTDRINVQRTNGLLLTEWYGKMKPLLAEADLRTGKLAKSDENYYPLRKLSHNLRGLTEELRQGMDCGGEYAVEYDMRYVRTASLDRLVNEMLLNAVPVIRTRGIHVERTIQRMHVQTDPVLLHRVLAELMDNAVQYTPDNGTIKVSAVENNGMAEVVIDNPTGMSPEDVAMAFQRGAVMQSEIPARAGMGLYLVRSYCHFLGHTVELRADEKHTQAILRMKLIAADNTKEPDEAEAPETPAGPTPAEAVNEK